MRHSRRGLKRRYGHSKRARKLASIASGRHVIHNANSSDRDWTKRNFIFAFGAYGNTYVRAWGNGIDSALDAAVDWLADHKPGLLSDDVVRSEYERFKEEGMSDEKAIQEAELDTTIAGNNGHYLNSSEWMIVAEDPSHEQVLQIQGRK